MGRRAGAVAGRCQLAPPYHRPLASRFVVDYDDLSSLVTPQNPTLPHQVAGVARGADGFRARLTVEFPVMMLPGMLAEHGWHLACEFSNWIEAANYGVDA